MANTASAPVKVPVDLVEMGRIVSAYGVRGWVKIQPHASGGATLLATDTWWVRVPVPPGSTGALSCPSPMQVTASRPQGATVVAQLNGNGDRDVAEALKAYTVWIPRSAFPPSEDDEYYWVDLIGCSLYGEQSGQSVLIGAVQEVLDNGAHGILRVVRQVPDADGILQPVLSTNGKPVELLVPFVSAHVHTVDLPNKRLLSDWPADF